MLDTANLQALLSTLVRVLLPLVDVLKVRLKLWHEVVKCLRRMGIKLPLVQEVKETMVVDPMKKVKWGSKRWDNTSQQSRRLL